MGKEDLQPEDTPWITICPDPAFNIQKAEEFFCNPLTRNGSEYINLKKYEHCNPIVSVAGFSTIMLPDLADYNITLSTMLEKLGKSPLMFDMQCQSKYEQPKLARKCMVDANAASRGKYAKKLYFLMVLVDQPKFVDANSCTLALHIVIRVSAFK